jgi:hypothetical protein
VGAAARTAFLRRALAWALVFALLLAALTACAAILSGDFEEMDARVIGTSLGFAALSAAGASGAALRRRTSAALRRLGAATLALSGVGFPLLVAAVWT